MLCFGQFFVVAKITILGEFSNFFAGIIADTPVASIPYTRDCLLRNASFAVSSRSEESKFVFRNAIIFSYI